MVPIIFLIVTISVLKWSPIKAGLWSTVLVVAVSQFNKDNRMTLKIVIRAMENSAKGALTVSVACAVAGIIVGILSITGLGLKFSTVLLALSGGHKIVLLVFTMVAGLILGMGMTTTSVYIVLSVLVAPALVDFGVEPIAAHMFVFYFGILSCITPPVATAVFASASQLNVSPIKFGTVYQSDCDSYLYYSIFICSQSCTFDVGKRWNLDYSRVYFVSSYYYCSV